MGIFDKLFRVSDNKTAGESVQEMQVESKQETKASVTVKKVLIISDTHGKLENYKKVLEREKDIDMLIHCGDTEGDEDIIQRMASCEAHIVRGNCDWHSSTPSSKEVKIGDFSAFVTHGHNYSVNSGVSKLYYLGLSHSVNVVFFGHTHVPYINCEDSLWIVNPGSLSKPRTGDGVCTYAIMSLDDNGTFDIKIKNV